MDSILVVGSVALDSVQTPAGKSTEALGGSAVFFSLAARLFTRVQLLGVIGTDFPAEHRRMLHGRKIDLSGLQALPGKTFRWCGKYRKDFNSAKTLDTQLNVFEKFKPVLSRAQKAAPFVFLANIDPDLQREVLDQMDRPRLVACDTMNYWIASKKPALKEILSRVDVFFVNEEEARKLTGEQNNCRAARVIADWGPSVVVVKKGEHGALLMAGGKVHAFPAFPVEDVQDPTGAGDSFAGGFLGYLSSVGGALDVRNVKRAMLYGCVTASFNVESFSTRKLEDLTRDSLRERYQEFRDLLAVDDGVLVG